MGSNINRLDRRFSRPGICKHPTQQAAIAECKWRPQRVGNLRAKQTLQQVLHSRISRSAFQRTANGHDHTPICFHNAPHLTQCFGRVIEEHKSELAYDPVKNAVGKGQRLCEASLPADCRRRASRDRKHPLVSINSDDTVGA